MKEEALKLADELEDLMFSECDDAAAMIRRLVEELDKQFKNEFEAGKLEGWKAHKYHSTPQTKPLSDEEIVNIWEKANYESKYYEASNNFAIEFARAIEERHGIK